jgi:hypothetical protein
MGTQTRFDFDYAIKLRRTRQDQISRWKRVQHLAGYELHYQSIKRLDTGDALADAIDEMGKDDIVELIRVLMEIAHQEAYGDRY